MEIFPAPFSLGSSPLSPDEVLPVSIKGVASDPNKRDVSLTIKGINYKNTYDNRLKDTNFATVLYNKKTKRLSVIHSKAEFLIPILSSKNEENKSDTTPIIPKASDTFGSARLQKALREREKHAISSEVQKDLQLMGKEMRSIARIENSQKSMAERVGSDGLVDISVVLPHFDVEAIHVSDIYPINQLLPETIFEAFKGNLNDIYLAPDKNETKQVFRSVYSRALKFLHNDSNSEESTQDKVLLAFLRALIILFNAHPKVLKTRFPFPEEDKMINKVANMFTTFILTGNQKSKIMTPVLKQRLLNYILITLLHIDRYTTKIDEYLCQDLRLTSDQIRKHCLFIGCKIKKNEESSFLASLNAPLQLPSLKEQTSMKR